MTENSNKPIKHSEELREIVSKIPNNYNKIITIGLLSLFLILIVLSFIIKVPGQIDVPAKIISNDPPILLKSHINGKIVLLTDFFPFKCDSNTIIGMINNPASINDVIHLRSTLDALGDEIFENEDIIDSLFSRNYTLGGIENFYTEFREKLQVYFSLKMSSPYEFQEKQIRKLIHTYKSVIKSKKNILQNVCREEEIFISRFNTDSILYAKGIILKDEYNNTCLLKLNSQNQKENLLIEINNLEKEIQQQEQELVKVKINHYREIRGARFSVTESLKNLLAYIDQWEDNYVFISRRKAQVELANIVSTGDFVIEGQPLFHLVFEGSEYYCVATLPPPPMVLEK